MLAPILIALGVLGIVCAAVSVARQVASAIDAVVHGDWR